MHLYPSVRALHRAYQEGIVTPTTYTEFLLEKVEDKNIPLGLFTIILKDRALREAAESTERWKEGKQLGLFDGIPIVWKDLFDIKDVVTTGGSLAYIDADVALQDAASVEFYSNQGGINLGKVGLSEFAYSALGINPEFGTPENAYQSEGFLKSEKRVPGGSSSGTAVAVCKGLVSVGMGTDTSGSIRIPAAWHGLYGYKPSVDFYHKKEGIMPLSTTLDTFGPIAKTLQDCYDFYCLFQQKNFRNLADIQENEVGNCRFIIPTNIIDESIDEEVILAFDKVIIQLEFSGIKIEREDIPVFKEVHNIMAKYGTFAAAESSYYHQELLEDERQEKINSRVLSRMSRSNSMSAVDYLTLHSLREKLISELRLCYQNTIFLMPTVPMEAPILELLEKDDKLFHSTNLRAMSLTVIGNFLNFDSITLPMSLGKEGMPLGIMLSNIDQDITQLFKKSYDIDVMISSL